VSGILARNLVACPWSDTFGRGGRVWLAQVELPADERRTVDANLRLLDVLADEVAAAEVTIARTVAGEPAIRRLLSIPGLGLISAVSEYAVIGDVHRFARPAKLVSYLGLDPRVRQSGNRPAQIGHISHAGPGRARSLLVEAAHAAVRSPGPMHAFYARLAARRGHGVALVAVARKLAVLAWHLLHDETDHRWSRPSLLAKKVRGLELTAGAPHRRPGEAPTVVRTPKPSGRSSWRRWSGPRRPTWRSCAPGQRTRLPPNGVRLVKPRQMPGRLRGGGNTPGLRTSPRGQARPERAYRAWRLDSFIRIFPRVLAARESGCHAVLFGGRAPWDPIPLPVLTRVTLVTLDRPPCVFLCPSPRAELQWPQLARRLMGSAVPPRDRGRM
jgi:hypothetical protein